MFVLAIGVAMWSAVHFLPSVAPGLRERLNDAMGPKAYRAVFTIDIFIALGLIIWGYRTADWVFVYEPPAWGVHANNLLMLFAIYLFGVGGAKGWLATKIRHPQLLGAITWAAAHLLANGDQASVVLFGGIALWAVGSIFMLNRRQSAWERPEAAGARAEIMLIVVTLAIFAVIASAHWFLLGVKPFPG